MKPDDISSPTRRRHPYYVSLYYTRYLNTHERISHKAPSNLERSLHFGANNWRSSKISVAVWFFGDQSASIWTSDHHLTHRSSNKTLLSLARMIELPILTPSGWPAKFPYIVFVWLQLWFWRKLLSISFKSDRHFFYFNCVWYSLKYLAITSPSYMI